MRINIVKTITSFIEKGVRTIQVLRMGRDDSRTSKQYSPAGIDSAPEKDMRALYVETGEKGKKAILGYINKNQISGPGEVRLFSQKDNETKSDIYLTVSGDVHINGGEDYMVRYSALEEAFNELNDKFNTFANSYVPGGPSTPGLPAVIAPSSADITAAKIDNVKTN